MRTLLIATILVLGALTILPTPAAADHIPCFTDYDHGMDFTCAPEVKDGRCVMWTFWIGTLCTCLP